MKSISRRRTLKALGAIGFTSWGSVRSIGKTFTAICEPCKEAWNGLHRFAGSRYQFRYIEPKANLPNVFIYGDSISIGYTEYVRASVDTKASVYRLHENGSSSDAFIGKMEKLRRTMFQPHLKDGWDFEWDVIHFNVGLHDLKYFLDGKLNREKGKQMTSLVEYENNLYSIVAYLKDLSPKAKLIFATTTPVPENANGRVSGDSRRFNEVALEVMKQYEDIQVNDLYSFSKANLKGYSVKPNDVHFTKEGSRMLGIEVARVVAGSIGIRPNDCPSVESIESEFAKYEER